MSVVSLREYFATASSPFTKEDAAVIGPELEELATQGDVTEETILEVAQSTNSPLHGYFEWNDALAARKHRLHQAATMMRAIRVRTIEDDRPRVAPAYRITRTQAKSSFVKGHNVLHGASAVAVQKAKEAFDELTSWRARYQPYLIVWKDFARTFAGVGNQISEAEDVVATSGLEDKTDAALTELLQLMANCVAWRQKHAAVAATWPALAEQAGFMVEAIDAAAALFHREKPMERTCLRCSRPFQSGGVGNRLCERCV